MKWEYLVKIFWQNASGYSVDNVLFESYTTALNHFDKDRWELVTVNNHLQHTFKREALR